MSGGCLCGAVRYTLATRPSHMDVCHCGMCRRFGGGFGLNVPVDGITWQGADAIRVYQSSDWAERGFCGICGSSLFYRIAQPPYLSLNAGTLDDANGIPLTVEVFIDDKPDGYHFAGDHRRMTGAEVIAAFSGGTPT